MIADMSRLSHSHAMRSSDMECEMGRGEVGGGGGSANRGAAR